VRLYRFVVRGDSCAAIDCDFSIVPPFSKYAVMPVALNEWQQIRAGPLSAPAASPRPTGERVGALLVGYYDHDGRLRYAGGVGTGFNAALHASLTRQVTAGTIATSPFADRVPKKDAIFVSPDLVAEVEYRRWPAGAQVQQAAFKGLRDDKPAREVVRERRGA
jgi:hypothetical protein